MSEDFRRAGDELDYRAAEQAFARWLISGDWPGAISALPALSEGAAARLLFALDAAIEVGLVPANSMELAGLLSGLSQRANGTTPPSAWRFYADRLQQRVQEIQRQKRVFE